MRRMAAMVAAAGLLILLAGCGGASSAVRTTTLTTTSPSTLPATSTTTTRVSYPSFTDPASSVPPPDNEVIPAPTTTETPITIPPCTGTLTSTISASSAPSGSGYDITYSGVVTNGRSDQVDRVEVWLPVASAYPTPTPIAPDGSSSWSITVDNQPSPPSYVGINSITYDDDSEGAGCYPYPIGGRT
jgi:hypothetical protein